jgi:RNA recognition motif-containing protein
MNIYVGNLSFQADEESLYQLFAEYGEVKSCRIITDRETRRSKGFAFVEMTSDDDARNAISALNGADYMRRPLTVNEARPREDRGGFGGGGGGNRRGGGGGGGGGYRR